jgi:hypothetical protein
VPVTRIESLLYFCRTFSAFRFMSVEQLRDSVFKKVLSYSFEPCHVSCKIFSVLTLCVHFLLLIEITISS